MRLHQPKLSGASLPSFQKPISKTTSLPTVGYDPSDLSPHAIMQLQRTIGNQAIRRMLQKPNSSAGTLQRLVVVARPDIGAITDFVELTSIDYALKRAGGPVVDMPGANFRSLGTGDTVYIVGHGAEGEAGSYTGDQIADALTHPATGLPKDTRIEVVFTSCYAGKGDVGVDSVVSTLKTRLKGAGLIGVNVVGSMGPSVKADALGEQFSVVDPTRLSEALDKQREMAAIFKPQEKLDTWLATVEGLHATIPEKAAKAAEISRLFYIEFVAALREARLLLGSEQQMRGEHTGGISSSIQVLMDAHATFAEEAQRTQVSSGKVTGVPVPSVKDLTAFFEPRKD